MRDCEYKIFNFEKNSCKFCLLVPNKRVFRIPVNYVICNVLVWPRSDLSAFLSGKTTQKSKSLLGQSTTSTYLQRLSYIKAKAASYIENYSSYQYIVIWHSFSPTFMPLVIVQYNIHLPLFCGLQVIYIAE